MNKSSSAASRIRSASGLPGPCPTSRSTRSRTGFSRGIARRSPPAARPRTCAHATGARDYRSRRPSAGRPDRRVPGTMRWYGEYAVRYANCVGVLRAAVFGDPIARHQEVLVTQHVEQRHRDDGRGRELRALRQRRRPSASRRSSRRESRAARGAYSHCVDEPLCRGIKVVEHVLLALAACRRDANRRRARRRRASSRRRTRRRVSSHGRHAARKRGRQRNIEAAVAVEHRRIRRRRARRSARWTRNIGTFVPSRDV